MHHYDEYATNVMKEGGSGAGDTPIRIKFRIDRSYLAIAGVESPQTRAVCDMSDQDLLSALRREEGILDEAPTSSNLCPEVKDAGDGSPQELQDNGKGAYSLAKSLSINSVENDGAGKDSELVGIPTYTFELPGPSGSACPDDGARGEKEDVTICDGADRDYEEEDRVENWREMAIPVVDGLWMRPEELGDELSTTGRRG